MLWDKDWGTISALTYQEHIIPVIEGWVRLCQLQGNEELILMQDGAPGHSATSTIEELYIRGIRVICWPPFSPDLNPIEHCWNWMKDFIQEKYGLDENPPYE